MRFLEVGTAMKASCRVVVSVLAVCWTVCLAAQAEALPLRNGSIRFAVMGNCGTGDSAQYAVGRQLAESRNTFPFTFAIMLGDNIYGAERPQDFEQKFMQPYKALLDAKVEFNAALGNHDDQNQRFYKPYNLGGKRYRTFKHGNVRFFVLDSNYMDPEQVAWLRRELQASGSDWKIAYFHHPLYTTARRGPEVELRRVLEPIFVEHGVQVVFAGHEHVYERIKPQKGICYFTCGAAAKLRSGDTQKGELAEATFDTDRSYMLVEIDGSELHFQAVSRAGTVVDEGVIQQRK